MQGVVGLLEIFKLVPMQCRRAMIVGLWGIDQLLLMQCRHARVVGLLDIFELDSCTFATVLELCEGGDLDSHLQSHHVWSQNLCSNLLSCTVPGICAVTSTEPPRMVSTPLLKSDFAAEFYCTGCSAVTPTESPCMSSTPLHTPASPADLQ